MREASEPMRGSSLQALISTLPTFFSPVRTQESYIRTQDSSLHTSISPLRTFVSSKPILIAPVQAWVAPGRTLVEPVPIPVSSAPTPADPESRHAPPRTDLGACAGITAGLESSHASATISCSTRIDSPISAARMCPTSKLADYGASPADNRRDDVLAAERGTCRTLDFDRSPGPIRSAAWMERAGRDC